jgi:hypothetical protein
MWEENRSIKEILKHRFLEGRGRGTPSVIYRFSHFAGGFKTLPPQKVKD